MAWRRHQGSLTRIFPAVPLLRQLQGVKEPLAVIVCVTYHLLKTFAMRREAPGVHSFGFSVLVSAFAVRVLYRLHESTLSYGSVFCLQIQELHNLRTAEEGCSLPPRIRDSFTLQFPAMVRAEHCYFVALEKPSCSPPSAFFSRLMRTCLPFHFASSVPRRAHKSRRFWERPENPLLYFCPPISK